MSKAAAQSSKSVAKVAESGIGLLKRKCDCGNHTVAGGECEDCSREKRGTERRGGQSKPARGVPPPNPEESRFADGYDFSGVRVANEIPLSDGSPIDPALRHFMEARFGQDFSGVRLHTDATAAASAESIGALAYTSGKDIVFAPGGYAPRTPHGLHLLAHELTHVVQQDRHPLPSGKKFTVEPETSAAEVEARHVSVSVFTPGPIGQQPIAASAGVNRGAGWAILGGIVGAVVGGLLGALAGPIGIGVGAAVGAALGAWIGGASSNSKKDNKQGSARDRIHRLLSTSMIDWVVTENEAMQALGILQGLMKTNPEELFFNVMVMRMPGGNGEWEILRKKLPNVMRPSLTYFEQVVCHPDHGLVMPGDTIHVELFSPGEPHAPYDPKADDTRPKRPQGYEASLSLNYNVGAKTLVLADKTEVPVIGRGLKEAAAAIAEAYADPLKGILEISVDVTPVKRGSAYAGMGQVSDPETAHGGAVTKDKGALAQRDKRAKFTDLVPYTLATAGGRLELAVELYYREVDEHLDQYDDPQALWDWAKAEAEKRFAEFNKKSPQQEFLAFAQRMMARLSTLPQDEQARTKETYSRFMAWLGKHDKDPKLASYNPVDIWAKAYVNIISEEIDKSVRKQMDAEKQKKYDEEWKKAEVKFGQVVDYAIQHIFPVTPTEGIELHEEQISETTGEAVTVGYLITASPAERIIRGKIAADFMHGVLDRMQKDPEAFNKTSVKADFYDYLRANPEQLLALQLTASHPDVERQETKVDIPGWQTATEVIVGLIPFVGTAVGAAEVLDRRDLFGHPLNTTERVVLGVGLLLPGIFKVAKLGKEAFVASRVVKEYGLTGAEAARVYRIYTGLGEGSRGARLFSRALEDFKSTGRITEDPKVLQEMETVLKDLGMTEKDTAKALMPAVERQAETVAKEEIQAVKAVVGPISEDTEKLLTQDPALREALKENSLAATVLKKCNTPCFPPQATPEQVQRLESLLEQIKKTGKYDEDALRRFLYDRRAELDKALSDLNMIASPKRLREGSAAKDLNAWLGYMNSGGTVTKGVDPALIQAQKSLAHDIGVEGGRIQAGKDGLTISNFETPFQMGSHGQGFDDIAIKGRNWDKDLIYIIEHKGGTAKPSPGQMELDWVIGNIQRLYREGGPEGRMWAGRLSKALQEGRLRGKIYSTDVVQGVAGATTITDLAPYKATKVKLVP